MPILDQDPIFIAKMTPYDFTELMGQYALEIIYTNGHTQMLTTPISPESGNDEGDFKDINELKEFYNKYK